MFNSGEKWIQNKIYLTQKYFRDLEEAHILNPKNTREVRCDKTAGMGSIALFEPLPDKHWRNDKRGKNTHYFRRKDYWSEAVVYKDANGKPQSVRIKDKFYWQGDTINPKTDTDNGEYPPENEILYRFSKRSKVRIKNIGGVWQIKKLGSSAVLEPYDEEAEKKGLKEKSSAYKFLIPA